MVPEDAKLYFAQSLSPARNVPERPELSLKRCGKAELWQAARDAEQRITIKRRKKNTTKTHRDCKYQGACSSYSLLQFSAQLIDAKKKAFPFVTKGKARNKDKEVYLMNSVH